MASIPSTFGTSDSGLARPVRVRRRTQLQRNFAKFQALGLCSFHSRPDRYPSDSLPRAPCRDFLGTDVLPCCWQDASIESRAGRAQRGCRQCSRNGCAACQTIGSRCCRPAQGWAGKIQKPHRPKGAAVRRGPAAPDARAHGRSVLSPAQSVDLGRNHHLHRSTGWKHIVSSSGRRQSAVPR